MRAAALGFVISLAIAAAGAPALGADLAARPYTKAPAVIDPADSWAGFYLGVHGGYGWKQDDFSAAASFDFPNNARVDGVRSKGAVYGAQAGYNWQFGRVITGLEIDVSAADIKGTNSVSGSFSSRAVAAQSDSNTYSENVRYLGTARARLGWLPTDKVLLYGTAGLAWERLDRSLVETDTFAVVGGPTGSNSFSTRTPTDKFGWVVGVGAEAMLGSPNWIGRLEYLHYDMGQVATALSRIGTNAVSSTAGSQTIEVVRAGVSYKFGEPARLASVAYAKAPVAAPLSSWAGFYIGAHGGYGWANDPTSLPLSVRTEDPTTPGSVDGTKSKGWVGGGQFGHNWQYDRVVTGLEIDLSAADIKGSTNTGSIVNNAGNTSTVSFDEKVKYLGTLRGRLGWVPTDNVLLYGTAGLGWERVERAVTNGFFGGPAGTSISREVDPFDRFGWVAGVGGEMKLGSSNWIGRLEYLHYDFGRINEDGAINIAQTGRLPLAAPFTAGRQTIEVVRAGVSYKFGPEFAAAAAPAMLTKAPRMAAPLQSWAGFYLGAHGGYGWKDNDFATNFASFGPAVFVGGIKSTGWLGGGQAGYNWQYTNIVAGLEIDGSASGIKGSSIPVTNANGATDTLSDNVKYLGTARGRLGWTPAESWLLYGTGGLAWERAHRTLNQVTAAEVFNTVTPRDNVGWVAGVGVERFIGGPNWIARLEYLHYDFGTVENAATQTSSVPGTFTFADKGGRQTIETVRAAVSYKFTP